jgi:hypothetical protein
MTSANYTALESASPLTEQKPYTHPNRKLVQGVGTNDNPGPVVVDGKIVKSYNVWTCMIARCYSERCLKKRPTYTGCSVSKDWLLFSNFQKWFDSNYIEGCQLDKDLLIAGNLVYSAETCVFVTPALNTLLSDHGAARGDCPLGVSFRKDSRKYSAHVNIDTEPHYLGLFDTALEAHRAYQLAKANVIEAFPTDNPRIRAALDKRVAQLRDDHANGRITVKL